MRLRQLATSQSIVFFATPEVNQSILDHNGKMDHTDVDSSDVVRWLLEQTCRGIEQLQSLYNSQGLEFCRRSEAAIRHPKFLTDQGDRDAYLKALRNMENHKLEDMYRPSRHAKTAKTLEQPSPSIATMVAKLEARGQTLEGSGRWAIDHSALQEVEQEREVAHEVEAVRKVQKPILYSALPYEGLHPDILRFAKTGKPNATSTGYESVLTTIQRTATGKKHNISHISFSHRLFVSKEFSRTVRLAQPDDAFLVSILPLSIDQG